MHISYFHGTKGAHVQVTGHERFTACLALLGFVLSVDDLPEELPVDQLPEGVNADQAPATGADVGEDLGNIKTDDTQSVFDGFTDKDEVVDYMLKTYGVTISKHGNLETVKEKAIEHINSLPGVNGGTNEGE